MKSRETISEFFEQHGSRYAPASFSVNRQEEFGCGDTSLIANRRDFYKISLIIKGSGLLSFSDKSIHVQGPCLSFMNPMIPYSWQPDVDTMVGYFCLFTEDFIDANLKNGGLAQSPLFKAGGNHIFFPDQEKTALLSNFFEQMINERESGYANKYDLIRSYLQIIMHEAMKLQPPETWHQQGNAAQRISELFLELLERQFPIEPPHQVIRLKNANEFAHQLSVHTNHLNRALKEATGKTTTEWITERLATEAKALLLHSNRDVAEIGYCLGFEHASNFNIFFKKQTGTTPNQFRKQVVSIS
ncbi:AraC family transcriptional regulator [Chitinophaga vietnamensis]|uniref:AraC family transcriptional regulator n=1 Tax=Chitinophaga vietnamensis TaxID=2593957 RepID=UPI001178BEFE|nr:AraC family transcriptional regulator [Chitinophaga vietnamensis]